MAVLRTITRLARDFKLSCVSEGIEDPRELQTLKEFGCDYGQGFLFSRPVAEKYFAPPLARDQLWLPGEQTANLATLMD
jgi:EAL domain-containing protein (putative c-di-GMP-specific phosphodiesterase class I)